MTEMRFRDISRKPQPNFLLPGPYVFDPIKRGLRDEPHWTGLDAVTEWCTENYGEGEEIDPSLVEVVLKEPAWGYWRSGTIFFSRSADAMWFKMRWC